jgi:hypothetical protein
MPYGILFGGDRYLIFTICRIPNSERYGLVCSDVLNLFDENIPFMSIMVFCLLGASYGPQGPILLDLPSTVRIPHPPTHPSFGRTRQATRRWNVNTPQSLETAMNNLQLRWSTTLGAAILHKARPQVLSFLLYTYISFSDQKNPDNV